MSGHHHESCPRRALQQGELVVDTSRAPGQGVTGRVRLFRRLNFRLTPEFLIDRNVTCNDVMATARCFLI